jgi:multiple sugar transport system substrate-binding protein
VHPHETSITHKKSNLKEKKTMRKSIYFALSLLVLASMLLTACGGGSAETPAPSGGGDTTTTGGGEAPASGEKRVLKVWSFTNEIRTMAVAFEGYYPDVDVDVVYTMIPMTDGEYQTKLKAAIGTADAPDVVALGGCFRERMGRG